MARRRVVEDSVSHERWLVSYADFITLLFAFFVVMYSISQVNEGKYKVLSQTLSDAFTSTQLDTGKAPPDLTLDPFQVGDIAKSNPLSVIKMEAQIIKQNEGDRDNQQQGVISEHGGLPNEFEQISNKIEQAFGDLLDSEMITIRGNEEWLEVELNSALLFSSGDASINTEALELLGSIAQLLKGADNPVRVEGFTDNVPINTSQFPSNWELSTARAAAVVQLFTEEGLDPSRFAAIGYGEFQPVADNSSAEGRARNRRVVLMISKTGELRPSLRQVAGVDQLIKPKPEPVIEPTGINMNIPGVDAVDEPAVTAPKAQDAASNAELQGIKTIELDDGGLLFTRDVETPEVDTQKLDTTAQKNGQQ